jgi:hypothetical protein
MARPLTPTTLPTWSRGIAFDRVRIELAGAGSDHHELL